MIAPTRRAIVAAGLQLPLLAAVATLTRGAAADLPRLGPPAAFDFAKIKEMARQLASVPYVDHPPRYGDLLEAVDFDAANKIKFRDEAALWPPGTGSFPVKLFHLHRYAKDPVRIFQVADGVAREVLFDRDYFTYGDSPVLQRLPADLGFAGFRVMDRGRPGDWLEFQSASYFRSAGELRQYGASARGVTVDTVGPSREEFPLFTPFWIEEPPDGPVVITALLDGFSLAGAFRFVVRREQAVVMDVEAALYPRKDIAVLGIAPITSMFWYSESARRGAAIDWRPEIHDSDGLAVVTHTGESLWRPLNNPARVEISHFAGPTPQGFGLLQRDRDFSSYQDDSTQYQKRPSVWIEPRSDWGDGAVELVEIPTGDEVHDNIVAYWTPKEPARAGAALDFAYRLTWCAEPPNVAATGRVIATRIGRGGSPGMQRPADQRKFVIDFAGGPLDGLAPAEIVLPNVTASRGEVVKSTCFAVRGTNWWRVFVDLRIEGDEPVELRLKLTHNGDVVSETWVYAFLPDADAVGDAIEAKVRATK